MKDPNLVDCGSFVIGVTPWGKGAKLAGKFIKAGSKTAERIAKGTRAGKAAHCFQCFPAGTKVLMADGSTKNIEAAKIGDSVLATDPVSGKTERHAVTALVITEHDKQFNELTITTPQGAGHLTATGEHPFWSPSRGDWVEASRLRPGTTLRTSDGGETRIEENRSFAGNARTYNLTVANLHTYYVLAGATPVLVHNSTCSMSSAIGDDSLLTKLAEKSVKNDEVQEDLDKLFKQLAQGNMNPGIGGKALSGTDVTYARGSNGGRLFFRNVSGGIQIVGKSDKKYEKRVIARLMQLYGK